ncbi:MAG: hypothetical protein B6229_01850 [Spirochaetaceae bacterium 4572_7]|nr:MAG: hypothetical protein B6229_01850 [Spirochaetaceae bacterium 4572_7]
MKRIENILGFILIAFLLTAGQVIFKGNFFRIFIGLGFGYTLTRGYMGFAGSVNRVCRTGSTKLTKVLVVALITMIFFGMGVFIGLPWAKSYSWINNSLIKVGDRNGVFMPDLFKFDGLNGYLGATLLTAAFVGLVFFFANKFEAKRKKEGRNPGVDSEILQESVVKENKGLYDILFVKPWSLTTGAAVIVALFAILTGVTGNGWGASTIHGFWFGNILTTFGASADALAEYTGSSAKFFNGFLVHPVGFQNFGIILGTLIYLLTAGIFKSTFLSEIKIKPKEILIFAIGGLAMGIGTRLSNGCNVGALYTPIANFSLSGWIFFIFLFAGGILGNKIRGGKKINCVN